MWSFLKSIISIVSSFILYLLGKRSSNIESKDEAIRQAEIGKRTREKINNLTDDERKRLRDKWTR